MKTTLIFLMTLLLATGCTKENHNQTDMITENAIIYYDPSGTDNCVFTIKTENNNYYTVKNLNEDFRQDNLSVRISYNITTNKTNCGFSGPLTLIEIISIRKI
jgi:hypothetical protein